MKLELTKVKIYFGALIFSIVFLLLYFGYQSLAQDSQNPNQQEQVVVDFTEQEQDDLYSDVEFDSELEIPTADSKSAFAIISNNRYSDIRGIMEAADFTDDDLENVDNEVFTWYKDEVFGGVYTTFDQTFYFEFQEPIYTELSFDRFEAENYVSEFTKTFLNENWEIEVANVVDEGGFYRVHFDRVLDGSLIDSGPGVEASMNLRVSKQGGVVGGSFILVEYQDLGNFDLIDGEFFKQALNLDDYPKTYFSSVSGVNEDLIVEGLDLSQERNTLPQTCEAQSVDLVYLFENTSQQTLVPTYKIECVGETELDGDTVDVTLTIYANAIDPEKVIVR